METEGKPPEILQRAPDSLEQRIPEPFPLVRYYLIASVVLMVAAFVVLNFLTVRFERASVIHQVESEAVRDIQPIEFDLSLELGRLARPGDDIVQVLSEQREALDRVVLNTIRTQPIARVDLLTADGSMVYSTDPEVNRAREQTELAAATLQKASSGEPVSHFTSNAAISLFNGERRDVAAVITASPLVPEWSVGSDEAPAVYVVTYRDVSAALSAATSTSTAVRVGSVAATMIGLFLVLLWIVSRGQKFTRKAREELAAMLVRERGMSAQLDQQNAELQEANTAKSQFLSLVSHELKTPLTAIIAFAYSLRRKLEPSMEPREIRQFNALQKNGEHLKTLIEDLLDLSAAEAGKLKLEMAEFSAMEMLADTADAARVTYESRSQTLRLALSDDQRPILGDRGRLEQVMTNLLSNASKYSPEGSEVTLKAWFVEDQLHVGVKDQGMGISEEDQENLFTNFYRATNAVDSGVSGTGLGLVIVQSIVHGHGGSIRLESALGHGTTVFVSLPVSGVAAGEPEEQAEGGLAA
jgi:signal transduction histidine kinase